MEKEFVTYNQALALKELGFDEPCFGYYNMKKKFNMGDYTTKHWKSTCLAPLKSQAFRWFREKYNLVFNFISYNIVKPGEYHWSITWNDEAKAGGIVKTYEEAELECLIKLIEIVNTKKD